jgi:phosphate-selective porin OprO and OprP
MNKNHPAWHSWLKLGHASLGGGAAVLTNVGDDVMKMKIATAAIWAVGVGALAASPAVAQSAGSDAEIALLKQQMRLLEQKLDKLEKQSTANAKAAASAKAEAKEAVANANAAVPAKAALPVKVAAAPSDVVVSMPNNRPTICTADEQNCIALTSRVHFDVGGYDYRPNSTATSPQRLDDGENLRRARIGVLGKFMGDWNYALIYDFGGSSDGFGGTASEGGVPVGFLPGGAVSGVENAYLSYTGIKPLGGQLVVEGGVLDLPWSLGEATSSNDIVFMERASSQVIASTMAADDFRSAVGARWFNDRLWGGAYVTGPTTGAIHSASSVNPPGTTEQLGAVARVAGQVLSAADYSLHLGADAEFLIRPPHNEITRVETLTFTDRPELRIDPTQLISTGAIANVSSAQVYGVEAAGTYGPLFFQGEYFWYNVDRGAATGLPPIGAPSLQFQGGYAQASYVLTGETHKYNAAAAAYLGVVPEHPFSLADGGWGAWEIGGRVSTMDLNNQLGTPTGIAGGDQTIYTVGLNWYVNRNVRFMFDYLHGNIVRQISPTNPGDAGSKFDAFAMRTQVAF